jgi:carbamate kinase
MPRNAAFSKGDRVVIALGGNALGNTPEEQIARVRAAAPTLLKVIEQGNEIIITHGNGPQVGMIQKSFALAHEDDPSVPAMDLPECGAMSQGYIGYHLQQAIGAAMHKAYKRWHVATVVTQIEVDPDDPAFQNPTKPIGQFLTREQADAEKAAHPEMTFVEDSGRGWRRVVASPQPKKIVEYESILNLLDNEFIVIACGGGGIPVVRDYNDKGAYKGIAAVIDKDMGGELLAEDCHADMLVLLTAVDHVAINFGKPDQEELTDVDTRQAREYLAQGQFGKGSMEPKVRAAVKFAESRPGRVCIIGSLDKAAEAMAGLSGTRIHA